MKKIIIVTRSLFAGGAERVIAQLANYFASRNLKCEIITIDKEKILYDLDDRIKITPIGKKSKLKIFDKISRYGCLRRLICKKGPDVVLSMPEDIGIYVLLSMVGTGVPVFVSERNNPWVMPDVTVTRFLRKIAYKFAKGIIFQTETAMSFFPKRIQRKGIVLDNPVDEHRIPVRYEGKRRKAIVSVGRLAKQKNFPLLIRSFYYFNQKHPGYSLEIYGDGAERDNLAHLISKYDLDDSVQLCGRKENVLDLISDAAMFVLPSDYEGMPNVLIEAMCMGMPVVSTDCMSGGPKKLILQKKNGVLVNVGSVSEMVRGMEYCAKEENALKIGNAAYKLREQLTRIEIFEAWYDYLFNCD